MSTLPKSWRTAAVLAATTAATLAVAPAVAAPTHLSHKGIAAKPDDVYGRYTLVPGESLHTENSYKYSVESFQALAREAGFRPSAHWTDDQRWFSLHWLQA